jgi:hypothetical protein
MKIISACSNAKEGKEDIFKPTGGNENLDENSTIIIIEH